MYMCEHLFTRRSTLPGRDYKLFKALKPAEEEFGCEPFIHSPADLFLTENGNAVVQFLLRNSQSPFSSQNCRSARFFNFKQNFKILKSKPFFQEWSTLETNLCTILEITTEAR